MNVSTQEVMRSSTTSLEEAKKARDNELRDQALPTWREALNEGRTPAEIVREEAKSLGRYLLGVADATKRSGLLGCIGMYARQKRNLPPPKTIEDHQQFSTRPLLPTTPADSIDDGQVVQGYTFVTTAIADKSPGKRLPSGKRLPWEVGAVIVVEVTQDAESLGILDENGIYSIPVHERESTDRPEFPGIIVPASLAILEALPKEELFPQYALLHAARVELGDYHVQ